MALSDKEKEELLRRMHRLEQERREKEAKEDEGFISSIVSLPFDVANTTLNGTKKICKGFLDIFGL